MKKILIVVYVLFLENEYDILLPINISVLEAIELIQTSVCELSGNTYIINDNAVLYDAYGKVININNIVKFSGLKNGSKVILV